MSNTSTVTSEAAVPMPQSQPRMNHGPVIVAAGEGDLRSLFEAARIVASRLATGVRVVSVVPPLLAPEYVGAAAFVPRLWVNLVILSVLVLTARFSAP